MKTTYEKVIGYIVAVFALILCLTALWFRAEELGEWADTCKWRMRLAKASAAADRITAPAFEDEDGAWYLEPLVAHALGGLEGVYETLNCKEGLLQSLAAGYTLLEADLTLTTDDVIVCGHGLSRVSDEPTDSMTYLNGKVMGRFTPLSGQDLVDYMIQ